MDSFDQLIFQYDTGTIPPPFCFWYKIIITKTSGGYGLDHGTLYETETGQLLLECIRCAKNGKQPSLPENHVINPVKWG